jgi:hypothetical protein
VRSWLIFRPRSRSVGPVIFFYDDEEHPSLFGHPAAALMFIGGGDLRDQADAIAIFDADGRKLRYRLEAPRREDGGTWALRT